MTPKTHVQISNEESQSHRSRVLQDILAKSQFLDVTIVNEESGVGGTQTDSVISKSGAKEDLGQRSCDAVTYLPHRDQILRH